MSTFKDRISSALETAILSRVKNNSVFNEYYKRSSAQKADWTRIAQNYKAKTIKDWTMAVMMATDPINPRRGELMRFFESLKLDLHLCSCVDNRILPIQCAPFKLTDKSGTEDTEAHKLFERPWYIDIVKLINLNIYEGTKLIEMMDLNDKGELAQVTEIPQSNFIPQLGIVINLEWDTSGVSYREGALKDYYIQIGNNYNLGLFNQVAMIVLAKKLGLGSWMAYIDKFGVPPVFAITDRMDDTRVNELFEMLQNFRSNHFAVLKGNEKIEVPSDNGMDGYKSFEALNKHCDDSMSKFFLGGTGTSDAKSFVGSAEVHERLLKYRHQVDKLLLKFYMNEEIIPRLIKLSSVYAPLANLYFEFDESETMTLAEKIKAVVDLAPYLQFDAEQLAKLTGLPITGVKEILAGKTPPVPDPQKKKPNASVAGAKSYIYAHNSPFEGCPTGGVVLNKVFAATWDAATQQFATKIFNGEVKPSDLHKESVLSHFDTLNKTAETAWGKGYYDTEIASKIRENLLQFSGAKSYNLMSKLNELSNNGLDKNQYLSEAQRIVSLHNDTYLNVEKQFTAASTASAKDWQQFVKDTDIYPNLMFKTMEDAAVREDHATLDSIIKPVNDPFWDKNTPPLGFRCRCWIDQTTEDASTETPKVKTDEQFANNTGKTGEVFTDQQSYFRSITKADSDIVSVNTENLKLSVPYLEDATYAKRLETSPFADFSEIHDNTATANVLAANFKDMNIKIRPHLNLDKVKNPEYLIDGKLADAKRIKSYKGIHASFGSALNQGCDIIIIDLNKHFDQSKEIDIQKIAHKIKNRRANFENKQLSGCYVVFNDKTAYINASIFKPKLTDFELIDEITKGLKGLMP
ncbi:MAG: DUF935 family protein [Paludibacter sp.]